MLNAKAGLPGSIVGLSSNTLIAESGSTIKVLSNLSSVGAIISSGSARFGGSVLSSHNAAETLIANSNAADYLYLEDSSNQRSSYVIGSHIGGTLDGLGIYDTSGSTRIVNFSKESTRFYVPVVGSLVDTSGNVFNVRGYGATGAGLVDETAFFAATAAAGGNGAHIVVPPGLYLISGLTLAYVNQEWELASGATLRLKNSGLTPVVTITGAGTVFHGGEIDGNKSNNTGVTTRADGIRVVSTGSIRIRDVIISNCTTDGIRLETVSVADIVGCQTLNCRGLGIEVVSACSDIRISGCRATITDGTVTSTGIQIDGRNSAVAGKYTADSNYRVHVIDCFASGHFFAGIYYNGTFDGSIVGCGAERNADIGIDLEFSDRVVITGCSTRSNGNYGIASFQSNENCAITGNTCRADGIGIISQVTSVGVTIAGNTVSRASTNGIYVGINASAVVSGNVIRQCLEDGIQIGAGTGVSSTIAGNLCELNGHHGININGAADCTVNGNVCRSNGQLLAGMSGIVLNGGAIRNTVTGNACYERIGTFEQYYGITVNSASDTSNLIVGNNLYNNASINFNSSGPNTDVAHNMGY